MGNFCSYTPEEIIYAAGGVPFRLFGTKEDIQSYEDVRQSGVTNMFAVNVVQNISGLSREKILFIMKNYPTLIEKFNVKRR